MPREMSAKSNQIQDEIIAEVTSDGNNDNHGNDINHTGIKMMKNDDFQRASARRNLGKFK